MHAYDILVFAHMINNWIREKREFTIESIFFFLLFCYSKWIYYLHVFRPLKISSFLTLITYQHTHSYNIHCKWILLLFKILRYSNNAWKVFLFFFCWFNNFDWEEKEKKIKMNEITILHESFLYGIMLASLTKYILNGSFIANYVGFDCIYATKNKKAKKSSKIAIRSDTQPFCDTISKSICFYSRYILFFLPSLFILLFATVFHFHTDFSFDERNVGHSRLRSTKWCLLFISIFFLLESNLTFYTHFFFFPVAGEQNIIEIEIAQKYQMHFHYIEYNQNETKQI